MRYWLILQLLASGLSHAQELKEAPLKGFQLGDRVHVGGWFDLWVDDAQGEDVDGYVPHVFFFADLRISQRVRLFTEMASINTEGLGGSTSLQRAYLEFKHSHALKWRLGQFNTPSGLWKEKHWHIMVDANRKPLMAERRYIPMHALGIEASGGAMNAVGNWDYSAFVAQSDNRELDNQASFGADVSFMFQDRYRFGSFYYDYMNSDESSDPLIGQRQTWLTYAEVRLRENVLLLRAERIHVKRQGAADASGAYAKLKWQINQQIFLNYRYDDTDNVETGLPIRSYAHTLTAGYWPTDWLRARIEYGSHKQSIDSWRHEWSAWLGFIF